MLLVVCYVQALLKMWESHMKKYKLGDEDMPGEIISCKELVLDSHGHLCMQNRLPGENEVSGDN